MMVWNLRQATRIFFLAATSALALAALPLLAYAQSTTASLNGRVVNGTAGGGNIEGLPVTLQAFRGEQEIGRWESLAQADGSVRFEGFDTSEGLVYLLSAAYRDLRYFSEPISLAQPPTGPVVVNVFETTEDASDVRIVSDSTVILGPEGETGTMQAMQVTTYENRGDRTYIGTASSGARLTVELPLPPQAFEIEAAHGPGTLAALEGGKVLSSMPLLPGTEEFIVTYRILYIGDAYDWLKAYPYPIEKARLLAPQTLALQPGRGWERREPTEINGVRYAHYEAPDGPVGTALSARFMALPTSTGFRSRNLERPLRIAGIGLGIVALGGAATYASYWGLRRRRVAMARGRDPEAERAAAVERLAHLDEDFQAGRLSQDDYDARRETERASLRRRLEEGR